MMNFNEGVASRYGIREAVIAQHLWELGEDSEFADAVYKDSKLWVRASATAIKCALPYFSKHQIKECHYASEERTHPYEKGDERLQI